MEWFLNKEFIPHGHCFMWRDGILWSHILSDAGIALAYFSIPAALALLVIKRRTIRFAPLVALFAVFIIFCGITHIYNIITIWNPVYVAEAFIKVPTAIISLITAAVLLRVLPDALRAPSPEELAAEAQEARETAQRLQMFESMVKGIQDYAIYMLDVDGKIASWNPGAESFKGYKEEEVIGKHFSIFYTNKDLENDLPKQALNTALETGRFEGQGWRIRKDGSRFWAHAILDTLRDEQGVPIGFAKITRDVTEQRNTEMQMRTMMENLKASNKDLEQFSFIASHDLNEPLRKIMAFGDILEEEIPNITDDGKQYLGYIKSGAERMRDLLTSLLSYSRVTTRGNEFEDVNLADVIDNVKDDLQILIDENNATLEVQAELPTLPGDRSQIRQVIQNIVQNAIRYRKDDVAPHIRISAERIPPTSQYVGGAWQIIIEDNGQGFEPKYKERIFEVFQRLDAKTEQSGTGMGLAICKRVCERHGGRIWADSEPGKGAKFVIELPAVRSEKPKTFDTSLPPTPSEAT